jgi:hypothetical protein
MSHFELDEDAIQRLGTEAVAQLVPLVQARVDQIFEHRQGKPVEILARELESELQGLRWPGGRDDLIQWAAAIEEGRRIVLQPGQIA